MTLYGLCILCIAHHAISTTDPYGHDDGNIAITYLVNNIMQL